MKIIHGSLSGLLGEVTAHGPDDGVRVAALMQSTVEGAGMPRYTSWVIVSGRVAGEQWAEWRLVVGRQRAEITEHGVQRPGQARRSSRRSDSPRCGAGSRRRGSGCARASSPRTTRRSRGSWASMRATGPRPAGAAHDLGWRDALAERASRVRAASASTSTRCSRWLCGQVDPDTARGARELACPGPADGAERQPRRDALPPPSAQGPHRLSRSSRLDGVAPWRPRRGPRRAGRWRGSGAPDGGRA